jgi:outer membrane protein TolC
MVSQRPQTDAAHLHAKGSRWLLPWVLAIFLGGTPPLLGSQTLAQESKQTVQTLTLAECVALTLTHNKTIRAAYLDRVAQRFDLRVAESKFTPRFLLSPSAVRAQAGAIGSPTLTANTVNLAGTVEQDVTTGARINLRAGQTTSRSAGTNDTRNLGWTLELTQPLLKGAGTDAATASVRLGRLAEQSHLWALKSIVANTLTEVIRSYRQYVRALKALDISRQSVARARDLLAINRTLIQAGRMAEIDMIQSESDLANQEFSLLAAENEVDAARLSLVKLMGLDTHADIRPEDALSVAPVAYELEQALALARTNRPDFQTTELAVTVADIRLALARNQQLPDLSLVASYGQSRVGTNGATALSAPDQWSLGLRLNVPLNDLRLEQVVVAAEVEKDKADVRLAQEQDNLILEVRNALRQLDMSWRQVGLSQRALALAEKKFDIETEKFKVGRSSNFQLVSFKNDLVTAQNGALNATIAYLDALTSLETTLGITLDTWHVTLVPR